MKLQILALIISLAAPLAPPLSQAAAQTVHEPARGSSERAEILDAVRPLVEARLYPPVEFVVDWMRSGNGWAFVSLAPQRPGGGRIDPYQTVYGSEAEFMDGLQTYALLRHQFNRWNIVDYAIGPTDVFWQGDPLYSIVPFGLTPN